MSNGLYVEKLDAGFRRIMTDVVGFSLPLSILAFEDVKAYWIVTVRRYEAAGKLVFDAGTKVGRYALKRIDWRGPRDIVVHVNPSTGEDGSRVEKVVGVYHLDEGGLREYSTDPYMSGMLKRVAGHAMGLDVYLKQAERSAIEEKEANQRAREVAEYERKRREEEQSARLLAEQEAIAHPTIGGTQNGKVLLGLLRSEGPASVAEDVSVENVEPDSKESGRRPAGKNAARAKGRDGDDKPARGNKHAGGKARKSHYPQMDDDVPVGARYH